MERKLARGYSGILEKGKQEKDLFSFANFIAFFVA